MKVTVDTEVLKRENLTFAEFLIMLLGYHNVDYESTFNHLVEVGLIEPNLFSHLSVILSDNSKSLVTKILLESDERITKCGITDFEALADKIRAYYPEGNKPGTTYSWRSDTKTVARKLRTLIVKYNFPFTEEEALQATEEWVNSFKDYKHMPLLRNFLLEEFKDSSGFREFSSMFMTIIENNREQQ